MTKIIKILLTATICLLVFHFFLGFMVDNVDTYNFHAFAMYLRTGIWKYHLSYKGVLTGSPPLYSVLLAILYSFPRSDIILHAIDIFMLAVTAYLLYVMLKQYVGKVWAAGIAIAFVWIPGNLVYISYVLSDLGAQFLFTVYIYLIYVFFTRRSLPYLASSVLVGFFTGLWRYSFIIFGPLSLLLFILNRPRKTVNYIFPVLGIALITGWILYQHSLTGVWGLTDSPGIRYNIQMMWRAKVLPKEDHPSMKEIRKYIPPDVDLRQAFWDLEPYILPKVDYNFAKSSEIIGNVGKAAMYEHPLDFLRVSFDSEYKSYIGIPYAASLATVGLDHYIDWPPISLNQMETLEFGNPIIMTKQTYSVWNAFISYSNIFYYYIFPVFSFGIFLPSLLWVLVRPDAVGRMFIFLYITGRAPIALATFPNPRYIVPFYPLMILIVGLAVADLVGVIRKRWILRSS